MEAETNATCTIWTTGRSINPGKGTSSTVSGSSFFSRRLTTQKDQFRRWRTEQEITEVLTKSRGDCYIKFDSEEYLNAGKKVGLVSSFQVEAVGWADNANGPTRVRNEYLNLGG